MDIVLEAKSGERRIRLKAGHGCVVPRGTWHRAVVRKPGQVMFITPGKGPQHRPVSR